MIAKWTPAVLTPAAPEHVSRAYRTALTNLVGAPSDLAVAVLHAQGALETGHFRNCWNYNAGNIKAGQSYEGEYCTIKLNEIIKGKTVWFAPDGELQWKDGPVIVGGTFPVPPGHPQTRMRAYRSLASGVQDKIKFLAGAHWKPALEKALAGDPTAYVETVRALGYFTAALEPYQRAVVSLTQKYLPVAKATAASPPEALSPYPEDSPELCHDMAECFRFELPDWLRARLKVQQAAHVDEALEAARANRDKEIAES